MKGFRPESALLSSAILDFVEKRLHKILHPAVHAVELLEKVRIRGSAVLADRAYGARAIREYISAHGASYVIP
ncbi:transposase, partial [Flavonifractor sp. DFI.6.63]|uniref:transposase n=1 Tax=Flavonifractor sp. DFI.6.63 TaxID=2963704 RepID=UPI003521BC4E